jgi:hypothetical protein
LFMSKEHSAKYRNIPISLEALRSDYIAFRDNKIPKLLKRPDVSEEDKKHLQFLKDTKKWYPYILRHSSLTKLKDDPNVNDYTLRQHAGWSKKSDMPEIYTHDLKGDSVEHVMLAYGIKLKNGKKKRNEHLQQEMVGPHCPFCKMVNIPNSQFCSSCHKPLSLISYNKVIEEAEQTKKELAELKAKQEEAIRKEEQREYDMEDMQEKLKAVQEQLNGGLLDMFLSHLKIYEPELAQYLKDKKDKNEKISIKEEEKKLPKPKTWQGEAIISSYGLENEELLRARNLLKYYPEQALKVLNDEKNKNENEEKKKC